MAFRRASYPPGQVYQDERWYRWCFENAPTAAERPAVWIYEKEGQVQAHQAGIRVELKVGDHGVPALWASELMVTKALQLRGIGTVISSVCVGDEGFALGFEVSPAARKALVRDGWTDAGEVPYWFRPLNASTIIAARKDPRLGKAAGAAIDVGLSALHLTGRAAGRLAGLRFEEVPEFDERADAVWAESSPSYPVIARRDLRYLSWRYGPSYPWPRRYHRFYLTRGSRTLGWAVLRQAVAHELPSGMLVDFLCPPGWTAALLFQCLEWMRRQELKAAYCVHRNPVATQSLRLLGFIPRPSSWPLLFKAPALPEADQAIVRNPDNWFITGGDSDVDRPQPDEIARGLPET